MTTTALPIDLAHHAEQLLTGTGLTPADAISLASGARPAGSANHAIAVALRDGWAAAQGLPCVPTAGSSAVEWYDLGLRLHAHTTGTVSARLSRAPIPHVPNPIAVRAHQHRDSITVTVASPGAETETATDTDALDLLHRRGVRITTATWRSLVTDDDRTIPALLHLARRADRDGAQADTAAHIGWWVERDDFPGTSATIDLPHACATRWATGNAPAADRLSATWRRWLGVTTTDAATAHAGKADAADPAAMLAVLDHTQSGSALIGLDAITEDDAWSWKYAQNDHASGLDWRTPDTVGRAAAGLRARCDIADLHRAALLSDPLHRRRSIHSGHVATGHVVIDRPDARRMSVTCDRLDARLRTGDAVLGWIGPPDGPTSPRWNGTVTSTTVVGASLILTFTVVAAQRPADGDAVTLMPAPPNAAMMRSGRSRYRRLYGARRSWLSTGRRPTLSRRDVPLDVLFAPGE